MTEHNDTTQNESREFNAEPTAFTLLLTEAAEAAEEEGIRLSELQEMEAINQMRIVAEALGSKGYIYHSASIT